MSLRSLEFSIRETALNIRRHGLMSVAAISTVAVSLCVLGGLVLVVVNLNAWADEAVRHVGLSAFFDRGLDRAGVDAAVHDIEVMEYVREVKLVTRAEALEDLRERYQGQMDLSDVRAEMLEDSVALTVEPREQIPAVAAELRRMAGVKKVVYGEGTAQRLFGVRRALQLCGAVAGALTVLAALMIIHNTIRLTVFARRREIRIMELVGATDGFIRAPFLLEGMFHGLAGAGVTCVLLLGGYQVLVRVLSNSVPFVSFVTDSAHYARTAAGLLTAGLAFGLTGSLLSVRRFLHANSI